MAAWLFLALAVVPFVEEPSPTLTLVWHDSGKLFPAVGLGQLAQEVEEIFRGYGLPVRFHAASENEDLQKIPEPRVNALVLPGEDRRFGLPANAMAATFGKKGERYGIFVYYPMVRRTLGYRDSESSPRHTFELARALARIVAHEVVHVLAPESAHAESGLMTGTLTRDALLGDSIALDASSLRHLTHVMRRWSDLHRAPRPAS